MFGAVNSLFSGLALAGVVIAIFLQSKELELQRLELEETRSEIRGQREALEAQNETLNKQKFEDTFFNMLSLYNELVNSMEIHSGERVYRGKRCYTTIFRYISKAISNYESSEETALLEHINFYFNKLLQRYEDRFAHNFNLLFHITKFVDDSNIENKRNYTDLIVAQLSLSELLLFFIIACMI